VKNLFKKKRLWLLMMVAVAVLALAVAGCGTNGTAGKGDNGQEVENGEPAGDGSLARVLDTGVFTAAGSGGYAPFNFFPEGSDEVGGFDVDTGKAIAALLGVELEYVTTAWDGIIEGLRVGHYDAVLGSMAITTERLQVVNFTVPYYYSGAQLVVLKDSGITDPGEMTGRKIAVATGTTFAEDAERLGATVEYYEDDNLTLMELLNGRVDGVITDRLVAIRAMGEMRGGENLELVGDLLRLEEMALAIRKDDEELLDRLNQILEQMHADGTLSRISQEWFDGMDITVK
jgi:polar amino acid transport system substrate-binding protein